MQCVFLNVCFQHLPMLPVSMTQDPFCCAFEFCTPERLILHLLALVCLHSRWTYCGLQCLPKTIVHKRRSSSVLPRRKNTNCRWREERTMCFICNKPANVSHLLCGNFMCFLIQTCCMNFFEIMKPKGPPSGEK